MKIVFQHSGKLPVSRYGGTERILFWLMKELVLLGHRVVLIGHPLSEVEHYGIQLIKRGDNSDWRKLIPSNTDIVNLFYPPKFTPDFPCLVRIGGNGQVGEEYLPNTVFVSKKHAELHNSKAYIHNGISLEEYPYVREKTSSWENFFFMAKAKWKVKNLFDCERAVKQVKKNFT